MQNNQHNKKKSPLYIGEYQLRPLSDTEILEIYSETAPLDFPPEELRPVYNIEHLLARNGYKGLGLFHHRTSELLGYALFVHVPDSDVVLLDFYAILEGYRCIGLGSLFLQCMRKYYSDCLGILLETEDIAESATDIEFRTRTRRNQFYCRNGAVSTEIRTVVLGVPFEIYIMPTDSKNQLPPKEDLLQKLSAIYRFMILGEDFISYEKDVVFK